MIISESERADIAATSAEIIAGSGETVLRKRLDTTSVPASFDADRGEATDKTQEVYDDLSVVVKVFWNPSEKQMATDFGGYIEAEADVHVPIAADVVVGDYLVVGGNLYDVTVRSPAPLGGFWAVGIVKSKRSLPAAAEE